MSKPNIPPGKTNPPQTSCRTACISDFFDDDDNQNIKNKYNKNNLYNNDTIAKNQQEFGNRKRIKP